MLVATFFSRFFTFLFLATAFAAGLFCYVFTKKVVDLSALERYNPGRPTIVLDDAGKEWTRFQLDRREPVSIECLPDRVIKAFLAAEDHAFFSHGGISVKGIVRSLVVNLVRGRRAQGASTITQQLVKLLFLNSHKTFERKLKEQFYAILVERQFTKEQILQTYLNHVYFGDGIYGVEAASWRFWGISAKELSLEQAATLAGIVRSPSRYCPLYFPVMAQQRRNLVLRQMKQFGFITGGDYERARQKPLVLAPQQEQNVAPYVKEMLRIELEEKIGRQQLYAGGLQVKTTLSSSLQEIANKAFKEQVDYLKRTAHPLVDGGLISIEVATGQIKAFIGGSSFDRSQFNRASQARRQLGSIFKPLVYAAAVMQGRSFAEVELDEPFELVMPNGKQWQPQNANNQFEGPMTLARALSISNNIVTIKTLLQVGCDKVKALGDTFHIPGLLPYPSIALGCVDVTLKEAVAVANVFANHGVYVTPYYIEWVKDSWGNKIYKAQVKRERVLPALISDQVAKVLGIRMERLRAKLPERWIDSDSIGKTGTTNDFRTIWFVGSTPDITTGIYIGRDDNQMVGDQMFARRTAFPIWYNIHRSVPARKKQFSFDPALTEAIINEHTGAITDTQDPDHCVILIPESL